jgi:hypothetical protein
MRTTLKRGLGRAAAPNGNGKPVLPPGSISPVTVYRQSPRERSRMSLLGPILMWVGVAALVLAVGASGGTYLYFHESVAALAPETPGVKRAQGQLEAPLPGEPAVALVIGYDHRASDGKGAPSRSDTMMLVRADPQTDSISLLRSPATCSSRSVAPGVAYVDKIAGVAAARRARSRP